MTTHLLPKKQPIQCCHATLVPLCPLEWRKSTGLCRGTGVKVWECSWGGGPGVPSVGGGSKRDALGFTWRVLELVPGARALELEAFSTL